MPAPEATSLIGLKPAPRVTERGTAGLGSFEEPSLVMKDANETFETVSRGWCLQEALQQPGVNREAPGDCVANGQRIMANVTPLDRLICCLLDGDEEALEGREGGIHRGTLDIVRNDIVGHPPDRRREIAPRPISIKHGEAIRADDDNVTALVGQAIENKEPGRGANIVDHRLIVHLTTVTCFYNAENRVTSRSLSQQAQVSLLKEMEW